MSVAQLLSDEVMFVARLLGPLRPDRLASRKNRPSTVMWSSGGLQDAQRSKRAKQISFIEASLTERACKVLHKVKKKRAKQYGLNNIRQEENGVSREIKIKCRKIWSKYS